MPKFVKCKNCGEAMPVDVTSEVLHCEHCGRKYKNPYFKPQEIEEVAPEAPIEAEVKEVSAPMASPISVEMPRASLEATPKEPKKVVRAPKLGVAIARLIFAIIALAAIVVIYVIPTLQFELQMESVGGTSDDMNSLMSSIIVTGVMTLFAIINLATAATSVAGKVSQIKSNRSSSIVSAIFSLIMVLMAAFSIVIYLINIMEFTSIEAEMYKETLVMACVKLGCGIGLPNLIVFILSCVCTSQLKKAIKNPDAFSSEEEEEPVPERSMPEAHVEPIAYIPVQNQSQQTGYIPVYGAPSMRIPGAKSEFNGGVLSLIGLNIVNYLILIFTLGLGAPWVIRREYTWLYEHQVIDGRKLEFTGKASSLLGQWIKWIFLSIITLGIYAWLVPIKKMQWITENTHIEGIQRDENNNQSHFDGKFWSYLGERIIDACIITFTCGICTPWAICRMQRWELEHQRFDGQRLVFDGSAGSLLGQWIKWCLLSVITFGIYVLWIPIKKQKWITEHTHFEV